MNLQANFKSKVDPKSIPMSIDAYFFVELEQANGICELVQGFHDKDEASRFWQQCCLESSESLEELQGQSRDFRLGYAMARQSDCSYNGEIFRVLDFEKAIEAYDWQTLKRMITLSRKSELTHLS